MTLAERPRAANRSVVREIADRRLAEVRPELDALGAAALARMVAAAPEPRGVVDALAAPGLHLIAEVKRRSPSAGAIVEADDAVARARAYAAGGAAVISVLCEPHWFGGSVDDLRAVRAAVSVPVLAKEFVVDPRQLDLLRAAGADLVLLLAVLHPAKRLARLVGQARDLGLEPLVEAHDARELESAIASGARIIGINNRDLRTLDVDPERAVRLHELVPGDRIAVAESGVRDTGTVARWRATGFDAALVGEALMRSPDPAAAARAFVAAGRDPSEPAQLARLPHVKICGVTDEARHPRRGPRRRQCRGPQLRARDAARAAAGGGDRARAPRPVGGARRTAPGGRPRDREPARRPASRRSSRRSTPTSCSSTATSRRPPSRPTGRPTWKALRVSAGRATRRRDRRRARVPRRRRDAASCSTPAVVPTRAGPGRGSTSRSPPRSRARSRSRSPAASIPRTSPGRCSRSPRPASTWRRGTEGPRVPGERPRKDPLRVALFTKRANDARRHRPNAPFGPTPVHAGLLDVDGAGRWGVERDFGGRYVPETLVGALEQLESAYDELRHDPRFWAELDELLGRFAGRPTPLYRADNLAAEVMAAAESMRGGAAARRVDRLPGTLRLYLKREDLTHTGAHKINNALGQALLTRRLGKSRVIAETGAGQHGVATATACALLGLPCVVFMGEEDIQRQAPNVLRMRALGAEVRSVTSGTATLKDAVNEAMRDWVTNVETTHYVLGQRDGPAPVPHDRPRLPAPDRRRGRGPAGRRRGAAAGHGARVRRRRLERHRAARPVHRRAVGPAGRRRGGGRRHRDRAPRGRDRRRDAGDPPRQPVADAPGPRRPGRRGAQRVGRPRLPGDRAAARGARRGGPARGRHRDGPRGRRGDEDDDPRRGHPAGARDRARDRRPAQDPRRARGRRAPVGRRGGDPARVLRARRQGPRGARAVRRRRALGHERGDDRRAARVLPLAPRDAREGDVGRRRARGRRHVPGEGQDLRHDRAGRPRRRQRSGRRSTSRPSCSTRSRACSASRRTWAASGGSWPTSTGADDELLRGIIEGAWRRTAPKAVVEGVRRGAA